MAVAGNSGKLSTLFDEAKIFSILRARPRRRLLVALAAKGAQTAADLKFVGSKSYQYANAEMRIDATSHNLALLVEAGVVVASDDTGDRRRFRYSLSPAVKVEQGADKMLLDFGCCLVRLDADGG
jgi:DNA-binding transcriptional ArsR family regulator